MEAPNLRRALALLTSAALTASLATTALAVPVAAQTCTASVDGTHPGDVPEDMVLCGGAGDDTVTGHVYGTFIGNDGDDTVDYSVAVGGTFEGGAGDDRVGDAKPASGGAWYDYSVHGTFIGGPGDDSIAWDANGEKGGAGTFVGGAGNDTIGVNLAWDATFDGGPGDDRVDGSVYRSTFEGGLGDDTVTGNVWRVSTFIGGPDVTPAGSTDDDTVGGFVGYYNEAPSTFIGGAGHDTVTGYVSNSTFDGGPGDDTVTGNVGSYSTFDGGDGDDTARYVSYYSTFDGGDGDDTVGDYVYDNSTFDGGPGDDTVGSASGSYNMVVYNSTFYGRAGNDTVTGDLGYSYAPTSSAWHGTFEGGPGDDTVLGRVISDRPCAGGAGDDSLERLVLGTFDGGADFDIAAYKDGGTCIDVEVCGKQTQSIIDFDLPVEATYGDVPLTLGATATSGLPVRYVVTDGPCTIVGADDDRLRLDGKGTCTVKAKQPGDAYYFAADPVTDAITIKKALLTVTCEDQERINLMPNPTLTVDYDGFVDDDGRGVLSGTPTCETDAWKESPAGEYAISFEDETLTADDYAITWVPGTLTVIYVAPITWEHNVEFTSDDVDFTGNVTIRSGDLVTGNVAASDVTLKVEGTVEGNVVQSDGGGVIVNAGLVQGHIKESGDGDVVVNHEGTVEGLIDERGRGDVEIYGGAHVLGNVLEFWDGGILVGGAGTLVEGNVIEKDAGDLVVRNGAHITGNVIEKDAGVASVDDASTVEGKVQG